MYNSSTQGIIIFISGITILLLLLISFIILIVYQYQQKQNAYFKDIEILKTSHENTLLQSQLEIQEQTFQNISREIHDNIGQKITLAKLYLNTLNFADVDEIQNQIGTSVDILSEAITELSNLSKSMNSEVVLHNGLIKALDFETAQLCKLGIYNINFRTTGDPVFMHHDTEILVFRMIQEALNNIVKHAHAQTIDIHLHYSQSQLIVTVQDDGVGFNDVTEIKGNGLLNIKKRADFLKGNLNISSNLNKGTIINIEMPLHGNKKKTQNIDSR